MQYCYPLDNSSCNRNLRPKFEYIIMYLFFLSVSVCTVILNLLVIISISHFKQLHTPTNLLILSMAVADMIVGLFVMPLEGIRLIETCWYFGDVFCVSFPVVLFVVVSASLGNIVFISVDRYIAVSDPLHYTFKVTLHKATFCISITWLCSSVYSVCMLHNHIFYAETRSTCHGECRLVISFIWVVIDVFVSLLAPCLIVIVLYLRIYCVAKYQVKVINSVTVSTKLGGNGHTLKKSERKAAKTLGITVVIYLLCWMPYYILTLSLEKITSLSLLETFLRWFMYLNSCMNPIIYALNYPWFKISAKLILNLKIFEKSSSYLNLFTDEM
ncbi:trace amine-associated receptor 6-like [Chanos chanos]|uniref:Trace amine-associated receptor 6-like n=1 Tax=Chanos chanos TaxID=29144 RepID=A0A6J2WWU3_CHACN|nr:trace amine-associated receptor 6-like [Chanos chanos]